jgi:conjugative transposon TraN protein
MKRMVCLIGVIQIVISGMAQIASLGITTDKTTSLIFPFSIQHVDRGSRYILAQAVKEADNILLVKAASSGFSETNLSVITSDGSVYAFTVTYKENPSTIVYRLPVQAGATIENYANAILDNAQKMRGIKDRNWDMLVRVVGIYIKSNVMYFQIELDNQSPIDYDIDFLHVFIRDKKKAKRTAIQENELQPLYIAGNTRQVKANSKTAVAIALEKFTIPDQKYMAIQLGEKNGGRNLLMKVNNNKIVKAIPLPDLK